MYVLIHEDDGSAQRVPVALLFDCLHELGIASFDAPIEVSRAEGSGPTVTGWAKALENGQTVTTSGRVLQMLATSGEEWFEEMRSVVLESGLRIAIIDHRFLGVGGKASQVKPLLEHFERIEKGAGPGPW